MDAYHALLNRLGLSRLLCLACLIGGAPAYSQDVVIEDPIPLLQAHRDRMADRPLKRLGSVNPYLHKPDRVTSPYNTAMMVYDPLRQHPEGEEVTIEMLQSEVSIQKRPFFSRLWESVTNLFRRR
jgi:hypothetical protein